MQWRVLKHLGHKGINVGAFPALDLVRSEGLGSTENAHRVLSVMNIQDLRHKSPALILNCMVCLLFILVCVHVSKWYEPSYSANRSRVELTQNMRSAYRWNPCVIMLSVWIYKNTFAIKFLWKGEGAMTGNQLVKWITVSLKRSYNVDMVLDTVYLGTRHQELAATSFRTNFITIFFSPVSDVYISTSTDSGPRTVCGSEVNVINFISWY